MLQDFIQFLVNPVTNENLKTHTRIGMYKKMNRVIEKEKEKEKGRSPLSQGICLFLATDNDALC
ncbi:hypothetical protein [Bacillus sp. NH11B]|uniref:hypothetical protein n=1 Tax=Bacillus sp. NH11B TaxID=1866314 RepID=UPI0008FDEFFC|nr:hypothetical protein [Bacillus sp. NH11B]OJD64236.1 hypothetical protein BAU27_06635 [Bacillus sp. NH11B]